MRDKGKLKERKFIVKYIVTVETDDDEREVICTLSRNREITDSKEKAVEWVLSTSEIFPYAKYHIYKLGEVRKI